MILCRFSLALVIVLFLSSCTPTYLLPTQSWSNTEKNLKKLNFFKWNGKIGITSPQESGSASITWLQNKQQYQISLIAPFGSGGFSLEGNEHQAKLITAEGKHFLGRTPADLLPYQTQFPLPFAALQYWIRGIPEPHYPAHTLFGTNQQLKQIIQHGWKVEYLSYEFYSGQILPKKLTISANGWQIKIIIYQWSLAH